MLLMGKSTISTGPFSIAMLNYQRVNGFSSMLLSKSLDSHPFCSHPCSLSEIPFELVHKPALTGNGKFIPPNRKMLIFCCDFGGCIFHSGKCRKITPRRVGEDVCSPKDRTGV